MSGTLEGAKAVYIDALKALPVSKNINHVVGTTVTVLVNPGAMRVLVVRVESGSFRFRPGDYSVKTVSGADTDENTLTVTGHGYSELDGPIRFENQGGALPTGLSADTDYYVLVVDANTIKVSTDPDGSSVVNITGAGSGTNTTVAIPGAPSETVSDNFGSALVSSTDGNVALSAPSKMTVLGGGGTDKLTYWWLP